MVRVEFEFSLPQFIHDIYERLTAVHRRRSFSNPEIGQNPSESILELTGAATPPVVQVSKAPDPTPGSGNQSSASPLKTLRGDHKAEEVKKTPKFREDWEPIRAITDAAFKQLLLKVIDPAGKFSTEDCKVFKRAEGSFHLCAIMHVRDSQKYVIKVPAIGTAAIWAEGDAHNLRSEAGTMKCLSMGTKIPVPTVFGFDDTLDNEIGAPYIVMSEAEGMPARDLWYEHRDEDGHPTAQSSNFPSTELQKKRERFLWSLAKVAKSLNALQFDAIGALNFDGDNPDVPKVSHYYRGHSDGSLEKIPSSLTSKQAWTYALQHRFGLEPEYEGSDGAESDEDHESYEDTVADNAKNKATASNNQTQKAEGDRRASAVEDMDKDEDEEEADRAALKRDWAYGDEDPDDESFPLMHNDIDFQNIFVNDEGDITGIIDWDGVRTVPRYIGPLSLPVFLREDCEPGYRLREAQHMPWCLSRYRNIWASYVSQLDPAWPRKAALKSPLYHSVAYALTYGPASQDADALAMRIFKECEELRPFQHQEFLTTVGYGEPGAIGEQMLRQGLMRLFTL